MQWRAITPRKSSASFSKRVRLHPIPPLKTQIRALAEAFAAGVLAAVREASLEDLLAESGIPQRGPGPAKTRGGRRLRRAPRNGRKAGASRADLVPTPSTWSGSSWRS
jgi:hypothetical protein